MARPAPSTDRVVTLLEFLATEPERGFSLSELGRRLTMSKATLHAMTAALTDAGWLLRHPSDKSFRLGPALIGIGQAAAARELAVVEYARDEMQRLADSLGARCMASTVIGQEIVMLATAGQARPFGLHLQVGQRLPLVPPLGTVFLAWASDDEIDAWVARGGSRDTLDTVRGRGYSLGLDPVAAHLTSAESFEQVVRTMPVGEYLVRDLDPKASYALSHIAAPVFGADGRVALALTLVEFRGALTAGEVGEVASQLLDATRTVTKSVHGRVP
jgi:DNA-binding IclR family transcriptional regulator